MRNSRTDRIVGTALLVAVMVVLIVCAVVLLSGAS